MRHNRSVFSVDVHSRTRAYEAVCTCEVLYVHLTMAILLISPVIVTIRALRQGDVLIYTKLGSLQKNTNATFLIDTDSRSQRPLCNYSITSLSTFGVASFNNSVSALVA